MLRFVISSTVLVLALPGRRTHQLIRRPNVARRALVEAFHAGAQHPFENQHTCAGPHPDDEHVRSEVGVAAREVRAPEKLATALRAAQAFCHDANGVALRV